MIRFKIWLEFERKFLIRRFLLKTELVNGMNIRRRHYDSLHITRCGLALGLATLQPCLTAAFRSAKYWCCIASSAAILRCGLHTSRLWTTNTRTYMHRFNSYFPGKPGFAIDFPSNLVLQHKAVIWLTAVGHYTMLHLRQPCLPSGRTKDLEPFACVSPGSDLFIDVSSRTEDIPLPL